MTPPPTDLSATQWKDDDELAEAVEHDTVAEDTALWHTEPRVMFNQPSKVDSAIATQRGVWRKICLTAMRNRCLLGPGGVGCL